MRYSKVVAFRFIDSIIAATLFKKVYNVSLELIEDLVPIYDALVVGIPYSNEIKISGCMIFVNYFCQEFSAKLPSGNILVCDKNYDTITEMICDILEISIPEEIISFVKLSETIEDKDLAALAVLLESTKNRIFDMIIEYANKSLWKKILEIIPVLKEKFSHIISLAKKKIDKLNVIKRQVAYFQYNARNTKEKLTSKAIAIYALENYKTVFTFGCIDKNEVTEIFFASKRSVDKIISTIEQLSEKIICRKFRGFCKIEYPVHKDRLINILRRV